MYYEHNGLIGSTFFFFFRGTITENTVFGTEEQLETICFKFQVGFSNTVGVGGGEENSSTTLKEMFKLWAHA